MTKKKEKWELLRDRPDLWDTRWWYLGNSRLEALKEKLKKEL